MKLALILAAGMVLTLLACPSITVASQQVATADLTSEAKVLQTLRNEMSGGDPRKVSTISFYKRTNDGLVDHLQWCFYGKTTLVAVTVGRLNPDFLAYKRPAWVNQTKVLGLDAVAARVGAVQTLEDETWSEAGCWVVAHPYAVIVRLTPGQDTPKIWDGGTWTEHNATARKLAERAIELLAAAGYIKLPGEDKEGSLVVTAQTSTGELLTGLEVQLDIPGRKAPLIVTTDAFGRAKVAVPILKAGRDLVATASACTYTKQTRVGGHPMYLANPLTLEISNTFTLKKAADFKGSLDMRFYVRPIYVRVEHTDSSDPVTDCTVTLHAGSVLGPPIIRVFARDLAQRDAGGALVLRVPVTRTNGGSAAVVHAAATVKGVVYEGWEDVVLPSNSVESAAVRIDLVQGDYNKQFKKYRDKLEAQLANAGFSKEEIAKIAAVKISVGGKNSYKDGVIQIANGTLRNTSEDLLHEYGHLISDVVVPDAPAGVGGTHEVNAILHPNGAFDEGRAHFYSSLLGQIAGLPGAKPIDTSPVGNENCEFDQRYVHRALMEHYGDKALFATPTSALKNFREVQLRGKEQLGYPPRTIMEFIKVAKSMAVTEAEKKDWERIRLEYGFGGAP